MGTSSVRAHWGGDLIALADSRGRPAGAAFCNVEIAIGPELETAGVVEASGEDRDIGRRRRDGRHSDQGCRQKEGGGESRARHNMAKASAILLHGTPHLLQLLVLRHLTRDTAKCQRLQTMLTSATAKYARPSPSRTNCLPLVSNLDHQRRLRTTRVFTDPERVSCQQFVK